MAKKKSKLELYLEQQETLMKRRQETREELNEVTAKLNATKAQYEKLVADQAFNGTDHNKEIDKLDDKIQALNKKHRHLTAALKALEHNIIPNRIKGEDVRDEWNNEVRPKLLNELIYPKLEEVKKLKYQYCKAVLEAHEALNEFNREFMKYRQHFGEAESWKWKSFSFRDGNVSEEYFLTERDFRAIYGSNPKMPNYLENYNPEKEGE
mgnify:CR=1 FL=1